MKIFRPKKIEFFDISEFFSWAPQSTTRKVRADLLIFSYFRKSGHQRSGPQHALLARHTLLARPNTRYSRDAHVTRASTRFARTTHVTRAIYGLDLASLGTRPYISFIILVLEVGKRPPCGFPAQATPRWQAAPLEVTPGTRKARSTPSSLPPLVLRLQSVLGRSTPLASLIHIDW